MLVAFVAGDVGFGFVATAFARIAFQIIDRFWFWYAGLSF